MITTELISNEPVVKQYRRPMTLKEYDTIKSKPGIYDIITRNTGKPEYILDHDQIGFTIPQINGTIHVDAAYMPDPFNPEVGGYEIIGDIDGGLSTDLGVIPVKKGDLAIRSQLLKTITKLFLEITQNNLPVMSIKEKVQELLNINSQINPQFTSSTGKVEFSKN